MLLILTENELDRGIDLLKKIIEEAGITKYQIFNSKVNDEAINKQGFWLAIKANNPTVIITAGSLTTRLILGLKKSFKLSSSAGKIYIRDWTAAWIIPIYNGTYLLQRGKKNYQETLTLFHKIKKKFEDEKRTITNNVEKASLQGSRNQSYQKED